MSTRILPPTTAGIKPEQFADDLVFSRGRWTAVILLAIFMAIGFGLRVHNLGAESLGEDELNKLETAQEYRANGLSGKNGEHPFLMKGLQTLSIAASEKVNAASSFAISEEAALRFPLAFFGTLSILLIFLLASELFGRSIGLVAAAFWAVEPLAVGFDRIAKEDSLVLFFFLLMLFFWVRSQSFAERIGGQSNWLPYAAGAAFGALMASKYYPFLLAIPVAYYGIFLRIPGRIWDMGKWRYLWFFGAMGITFLILNPTILLPDTWREMLKFSSQSRVGHDSFEFLGHLYIHKMTAWLAGIPWYFYPVIFVVKSSLSTLVLFLIGLPLLCRRQLGDGRFLLLFWFVLFIVPFSLAGGKFMRYFATMEPVALIVAAIGFCLSIKWLSDKFLANGTFAHLIQAGLFALVVAIPLYNSLGVTPHFRLFVNSLGGGAPAAGTYVPHDEFYDAATGDVLAAIAGKADSGAVVACETPALFRYYAQKAGRDDLVIISLSDPSKVAELKAGDFVVLTKGRRYFSNQAYENAMTSRAVPMAEIRVAGALAAQVYMLDEGSATLMRTAKP